MTAFDRQRPPPTPRGPGSYDGVLGQRIIAIHRWAMHQGLLGASAGTVFEGLCRHLVEAGVPLWRGFAGGQTLHPQWAGYVYTWVRDSGAVTPAQRERGEAYDRDFQVSPFAGLIRDAPSQPELDGWPWLRRRLAGPECRLDFPILEQLAAGGATDYYAQIVRFGPEGDPSRGSGVGYSFATDRPEGFSDDDLLLIRAVLPATSLSIMCEGGHRIASGLLAAYIGDDAGRRVHAGAIERGSVESIRAVLWYADIRGSTAIADFWAGPVVVELINDVFEALCAPLRSRGGQVLKFLGDGLLAILPFDDTAQRATCHRALDAAAEAMAALDRLNEVRREAGTPTAEVDLALHLGEVLYGNVGAIDRLDFTVIGPAVNEVSRIEALCEPLGRRVLVSSALAAAIGDRTGLEPLGRHALRGVRESREVFALGSPSH